MIVFISSPYGNDPEGNTEKARDYCRFAMKQGAVPYASHLIFPQFVSEKAERRKALRMGLEMLSRCDEMWCFGGISPGMQMEIDEAKRLEIPVRYFLSRELTGLKGGSNEGILR